MKTEFFSTDNLPPYLFEAIHELKEIEKSKGVEIIDFGMGNPDMAPPKFAIEALENEVKNSKNYGYSIVGGINDLKKAHAKYYKNRFGVEIDENKENIVTIGAKEGLTSLATAMSGVDGEYLIVPNPCYPIHLFGFKIAKIAVKQIDVIDPWQYLEQFKKLVLEAERKPVAVLVNYPCNPTTQTVGLDFYQDLVDFCLKHQIYIISDIAYCEIYFDDKDKPHSILEVDRAKEIAIEFSTMSKSFSMAGARVGFAAGNQKLIAAMMKMKSYLDYGSFEPLQKMAISCFENHENQQYLTNLRQNYLRRAKFLVKILNEELNWQASLSKVSMFIWLKIPEKFANLSSFDFCKMLIEKCGVALSPGSGFGENGEGFVRFSLIHDEEKISQAIQRLKEIF